MQHRSPALPLPPGMLHRKHWEHHNHTGVPHTDPDFHKGNPNLLLWYAQ